MAGLSLVDFAAAGSVALSYVPLVGALSLSVLLILFGSGPGSQLRAGQSRAGAADRSDSPAARAVSRRILRPPVGAAQGRSRPVVSRAAGAGMVQPAARRVRAAGLRRRRDGARCSSSFRRISGRRCFSVASSWRSMPLRADSIGMAVAGLALLVAGFYVGYRLQISATLADRVRMWQSPWDNTVAGGNQITHAIWAMATGGGFGTGLGLGSSRYLPAGHTDLDPCRHRGRARRSPDWLSSPLPSPSWRGAASASRAGAANDYGFFLATALTLFLRCRSLIMASGVVGLTPLTGVVTPFLSYGGSAMLANFAALGMLAAIHADDRAAGDFTPFRVPLTWLGTVLAGCAVVLVAIAVNVQVVSADDVSWCGRTSASRRMAAGASSTTRASSTSPREFRAGRFTIVAGFRSRPTIVSVIAEARPGLCTPRRHARGCLSRSRPSGAIRSAAGRFHVHRRRTNAHQLDARRTRRSWSATRQIACAASTITRPRSRRSTRPAGRSIPSPATTAISFPLLRHRFEPDHPAVASFQARPRDVRLTIDANLQLRVAAIVADYGRKADGRAAAVVLDPDTGAVLASASYPWPTALDLARRPAWMPATPARSRALRHLSSRLDVQTRGCPGGARAEPGLRRGDVHLRAVAERPHRRRHSRLDPAGARRCAGHAAARHHQHARGVRPFVQRVLRPAGDHGSVRRRSWRSPAASGSRSRAIPPAALQRVRDTLPQVGYGQAEVVASPLRMATVAAAVAADGVLRQPHVEQTQADAVRTDRTCGCRHRATARQLHARRGADRYRPQPARASRADCGQDRHRGSVERTLARLVRRVCAVWPREEAHRLRDHRRARGIRRCDRGAGGRGNRHRGRGRGIMIGTKVSPMDILRKVRDLEARISSRVDRTVGDFVQSGTREPIEIVHAIVEAAGKEVQASGRGRRVFPFNAVRVTILAPSRDARARFEAVLADGPPLRNRILERLRADGCEVIELDVALDYVARAPRSWRVPNFISSSSGSRTRSGRIRRRMRHLSGST